jgi:hypothetical protein
MKLIVAEVNWTVFDVETHKLFVRLKPLLQELQITELEALEQVAQAATLLQSTTQLQFVNVKLVMQLEQVDALLQLRQFDMQLTHVLFAAKYRLPEQLKQ